MEVKLRATARCSTKCKDKPCHAESIVVLRQAKLVRGVVCRRAAAENRGAAVLQQGWPRSSATVARAIDHSELFDVHGLCRIASNLSDSEHHSRAGVVLRKQADQLVSNCSAVGDLDSVGLDLERSNSLPLALSSTNESKHRVSRGSYIALQHDCTAEMIA